MFLETWVHTSLTPNSISIGLAVIAELALSLNLLSLLYSAFQLAGYPPKVLFRV